MSIALIDYRAGNLTSVRKALRAVGAEVYMPESPADLARASGVIVPGVGHFEATAALDAAWRTAILDGVRSGTPLLGICLGLQFLFEGSTEAPATPGLGLFPGLCRRLGPVWAQGGSADAWTGIKIPHVGWSGVRAQGDSMLLAGLRADAQAYFTHSYAAPLGEETIGVTTCGPAVFASAVERDHVFGVQFHPEKSSDDGLHILRNFLSRVRHEPVAAGRAATAAAPAQQTARRIIACLDVRDGAVVKGINFEGLRRAGDPAELAARYNEEGIDEVVILDVTATLETRRALATTIRDVARRLFIPLTVGGGIRTEEDAAAVVDAGADKVSLNTAALVQPELITRLATRYGSQAVIVAIDAKRQGPGFAVYSRSGTQDAARDAVAWAVEAAERGAGEILLTSIDRDGTRSGFDCELTAAVSLAVPIPVIASGGAGELSHFVEVFDRGRADAALAASIFHFAERGVTALKEHLAAAGLPVRPVTAPATRP